MRIDRRRVRGQAITEYIIIVAIVALGALAILGIFSDVLREKIGGAAKTLSPSNTEVDTELDKKSVDALHDLGKDSGN